MNDRKTILISLGVSVAAHVLFLACSGLIRFSGVYTMIANTGKFFKFQGIKHEEQYKSPVRKRGVTYTNAVKFVNPDKYEVTNALEKGEEIADKDDLMTVSPNYGEPDKFATIRDMDAGVARDSGMIEGGHKRETRKDIVSVTRIKGEEGIGVPKDFIREPGFSEDFMNKMPGITPEKTGSLIDSIRGRVFTALNKGDIPAVGRRSRYSDIAQYLVCELSTYKDPRDSQKYFRLGIRSGKDALKLSVMSKEILFLIDSSLSIQPDRLAEFKKGLGYCLSDLNSEDIFNIMAFKDRIIWFKPSSVKVNKENADEAARFVAGLSSNERTDAFNALYEGIKRQAARTPSYIMFFSDGRPTHGITDSRRIIHEITKMNGGKRPIFAFSGGWKVNRYLLDFISYRNRGWTEYADRTQGIAKNLSRMYDKIKDPLLLGLRYRASGIDAGEVYPKTLPDFYRNAEFNLYGKYEDEREFSVQLLGDINGETNEFIVVAKLDEAKAGSEEVARNWAFNRIYYLIGMMDEGRDNKDIIAEIDRLCKKFGIVTPYTEGIKD